MCLDWFLWILCRAFALPGPLAGEGPQFLPMCLHSTAYCIATGFSRASKKSQRENVRERQSQDLSDDSLRGDSHPLGLYNVLLQCACLLFFFFLKHDLSTMHMMEYVIPMLHSMVNTNILCCIIFQLYGKDT